MTGRLFIAEKPSVARAIADALGGVSRDKGFIKCGSDVVTWCVGHMMELAEPDEYTAEDAPRNEKTGKKIWRVEDLPIIPTEWILTPKKDLKDQIRVIRDLIKKATIIVNAGDPDREGQLLVDELIEHYGYRGTVLRYWASAQDSASVRRALTNLKPNREFEPLGSAAIARSRADWLIGMNLTRAYTLAADRGGARALLSVGRVQSPTLALVVQRDRKIESFRPVSYYRLRGQFQHQNGTFSGNWKPNETQSGLDEEGRLISEAVADAVLTKCGNVRGTVASFEKKPGKSQPPKAWSLANLQIAASAKHGITADQVLEVCQALYETHKLTSYPRTDCEFLPNSQHADAPVILAALGEILPELADLIKRCDPVLKSATWNDSKITAHHGIIPTQHRGDISVLSPLERTVYEMIVRAYLAQFLPAQEFEKTVIRLSVADEIFEARGKVITRAGWTIAVAEDAELEESDGDTDNGAQKLPNMALNDPVTIAKVEKLDRSTSAPPRFTDGTLIKAMVNIHQFVDDPIQKKALKEDDGIGTPATRSPIIKELKIKGYIEDKGKAIISTALGRGLIDVLHPSASNPALTAIFERILKMIETGQSTVDVFINKQASLIATEVDRLAKTSLRVSGVPIKSQGTLSNHKCPACGLFLARRPAKKKGSYWWGCSGYPGCTGAYFDNKGRPDFSAKTKIGAVK